MSCDATAYRILIASPSDLAMECKVARHVISMWNALIGLFGGRLGTPTGVAASGTVEEIERHLKARKPTMLYFATKTRAKIAEIDKAQLESLRTFQSRCEKEGVVERFRSRGDLTMKLIRLLASLGERFAGIPATSFNPGAPQYQGMVYQGVAANQAGWAYPAIFDVVT